MNIDVTNVAQALVDFWKDYKKVIGFGFGFGIGIGATHACVTAIKNDYVVEAGSNDKYIKLAPAKTVEKLNSEDK